MTRMGHTLPCSGLSVFNTHKTVPSVWTWRESNPRPKTYPMYFYYHSQFFYIPSAVRKTDILTVSVAS